MFNQFRARSLKLEHLDKGDYTAEEYEGCIVELQRVNQWLGDASVLRRTLLREIEDSGAQSFSVLDVGAGSGELFLQAYENDDEARSTKSHETLRNHVNELRAYFVWLRGSLVFFRFSKLLRATHHSQFRALVDSHQPCHNSLQMSSILTR